MIIFKDILFELFELLIAKRATVMPINRFFDASPTVYMPASCNIAIVDRIQTDSALELLLQLLDVYFEVFVAIDILVWFYFHSAITNIKEFDEAMHQPFSCYKLR